MIDFRRLQEFPDLNATFLYLTVIPALIALALAPSTAPAEQGEANRPLFQNHEILQVRIEAPFTTIMSERDSDDYSEGLLHIVESTGAERTFDLKLRTRGHYRGKAEHCHFAPLRINFRKKQVKGSEFHGQDKLKLVTHCENFGSKYEQSLLLEYLSYRILNQLTDLSFRVRLLQVDYIDTEKDGKTRSKYAFLIEDDEELSKRIGLEMASIEAVTTEQLDQRQTAFFSVFQYLIGNTDFSAVRGAADSACCHNAALFAGPDDRYIPVAYDFDLSGFVDAPYAAPNPNLKIKDVKQRLYRGFCSHNDFLDEAIRKVVDNQSDIMHLIATQDGLSKGSRRKASRYIAKFYDRVSNPAKVERYIVKECS